MKTFRITFHLKCQQYGLFLYKCPEYGKYSVIEKGKCPEYGSFINVRQISYQKTLLFEALKGGI